MNNNAVFILEHECLNVRGKPFDSRKSWDIVCIGRDNDLWLVESTFSACTKVPTTDYEAFLLVKWTCCFVVDRESQFISLPR